MEQQHKLPVCTFLKPMKSENNFYKTCKFIVKTVKNTQVTRFQKFSPDFKK